MVIKLVGEKIAQHRSSNDGGADCRERRLGNGADWGKP
jgi:hypothetical protein